MNFALATELDSIHTALDQATLLCKLPEIAGGVHVAALQTKAELAAFGGLHGERENSARDHCPCRCGKDSSQVSDIDEDVRGENRIDSRRRKSLKLLHDVAFQQAGINTPPCRDVQHLLGKIDAGHLRLQLR